MELIGSYYAQGYMVEIYFPQNGTPDRWTIWVLSDGRVVGEFTDHFVIESYYGMNQDAMRRLESAAELALQQVVRKEARKQARLHRAA